MMKLNSENYRKAYESITPSEEFLAETRRLMLEAAQRPSVPKIRLLAPIAAAAACAVIVTAVTFNLPSDNVITAGGAMDSGYLESSEESGTAQSSAPEKTEKAADIAVSDEAVTENSDPIKEEALRVEEETLSHDDASEQPSNSSAYPDEGKMRSDDVRDSTADANTDNNNAATAEGQPFDIFEEDDEGDNDLAGDSSPSAGVIPDGSDVDDTDDDTDILDPTEEGENISTPLFTDVKGGAAAEFPDFSPSDTEKLREFLLIAAQDEINAEVTLPDSAPTDYFVDDAASLAQALAGAAEGFIPCDITEFTPELTLILFDDISGELLCTVRLGGGVISVSVKRGEAFFFLTDCTAQQLMQNISAAN